MPGTRFYVELPADEYGNTAYTRAVIEVNVVPYDDPYRPERVKFEIVAPAEFARKWPTLLPDIYGGFAEVEGPARMLTRAEWEQLVPAGRKR